MAIATIAVAVLLSALGTWIDLSSRRPPASLPMEPLSVAIRSPLTEPATDRLTQEPLPPPTSGASTARVAPIDVPQAPAPADQQPAPVKSVLVKDWRAIVSAAAIEAVDEQARLEEQRASTWRRSRSIMFQPGDTAIRVEAEPVIADFRFKPQMHVVGLGLNIGSCFIGIPLAGVPVEQRTVAISVFVCAPDS